LGIYRVNQRGNSKVTKQIRIENADTSSHKVRVHVEQPGPDGQWIRVKTVECDYPTAMATEYIHSTQRLVVEEFAG
jgi:hypothetical protein